MRINSDPTDYECVDANGDVWPEHDYPPAGESGTCRRCGAEADSDLSDQMASGWLESEEDETWNY